MAIVAPLQGHFDGGEVSPLLYGRVDAERYKSSLALCKNWIPTLQGGLPRRPGTEFVGTVKNPGQKTRLIPFEFSTTQAYMLEFGDHYIRFWANYGQVLNGLGTPLEVIAPYAYTDLPKLRFVQSADVIYLVHPNYPPCKLMRFSATTWQLVTITFIDGPYQPINSTQTTLTPATASGTAVTITAGPSQTITGVTFNAGYADITIANHGWTNPFALNVSGVTWTGTPAPSINGAWPASTVTIKDPNTIRLTSTFIAPGPTWAGGGTLVPAPFPMGVTFSLRIQVSTVWGWATATSSNGYQATANVQNVFDGTAATKSWRVGFWYDGNYPGAVAFHEDRLSFSGTPSSPQRIDMSTSSNYENFSPSNLNGTVVDSNACSFSLNASEVNYNQWLSSDEKGLLAGSLSAEWILRPSVNSEAITPTNVNAKRSTKWGSAAVQAVQVGKATLHVQRGSRKLRELVYNFYIDGYNDTDLTELAEHITGSGVTDLVYTAIPYPIVWMLRNDGVLVGATYDRDVQNLRVGWHWHALGGRSDAAGSAPIIESIAVIPSPDGTRHDLWMSVQRYVNGAVTRTIEYLTKIFEDIDLQQYAFHLDCGLTYDAPVAISAITKANPAVITATAHGLTTGNTVRFDGIVGMTNLNGNRYTVTVLTANTFTLTDLHGTVVDSTNFSAYVSGGQVRKLVSTISGLSYLEGETVSIFADGAVQPDQVVSGGQITLVNPAAVVSVGYSYASDGELLRLEAGARNGTALGKSRRTHRVGLMIHRGQGLQVGRNFSSLDTVEFRSQGTDPNGTAPALFSGIESIPMDFENDFDNQICFRVSNPQPCTLLAIMPQMETQDRA